MNFDKIVKKLLKEEEASKEDKLNALSNIIKQAGGVSIGDDKPHRSPYEFDIEFPWNGDETPSVKVSNYFRDASDEELFVIDGTVDVGYSIVPGQDGGWDDPSWDPYPEADTWRWYGVSLIRYNPETDVHVTVPPQTIGPELYKEIIKELKVQANPVIEREIDSYFEYNDWRDD